MADVCVTKKNLGLSRCAKLPEMIRGMIETPQNFKATAEQAVDVDFWIAALLANKDVRIYLWPDFVGFTDNSEAAVYESTPLAYMAVRDGRYNFSFMIKENLCLHKAMFTHRAISGRVIFIDTANQWVGTSNDEGDFMGLSIGLINTEKLKFSDGSVSTKSPLVVVLKDNLEIDQNGALLNVGFMGSLPRLADVTLTIVSAAAAIIVVDVVVACDGTKVNGLVLADFALTETDGDAQVITTVTEDDGRYTLTKGSGAWVDGFLDLVAAADLTVEGFESTGKVAVNIP